MHLHIHCDFILCYLPLLSLSLGSKKIWKRIFPTRKTNQFQNSLSQLSRLHSASCPLFPLTSYPTPTSKSEIVGWSYSPHIRWRSSPPCSMRTRNITSRHMALEKKNWSCAQQSLCPLYNLPRFKRYWHRECKCHVLSKESNLVSLWKWK